MKKIILISVLIIAVSFPQNMRKNAFNSLFSDQKASYIGDAITIIVVESSLAKNRASTNSSRESDLGFDMAGKVMKNDVPEINVGIGSNKKVWWKCKHNHEWQALIANRTKRGDGCMKCNKKNSKALQLSKKKSPGQLDLI